MALDQAGGSLWDTLKYKKLNPGSLGIRCCIWKAHNHYEMKTCAGWIIYNSEVKVKSDHIRKRKK